MKPAFNATEHATAHPTPEMRIDQLRDLNAELVRALEAIASGTAVKSKGGNSWSLADVIAEHSKIARDAIARAKQL